MPAMSWTTWCPSLTGMGYLVAMVFCVCLQGFAIKMILATPATAYIMHISVHVGV